MNINLESGNLTDNSCSEIFADNLEPDSFQWQPLSDNADTLQSMSVIKIDDQCNVNPENLREEELASLIKYMEQSNESVRAENDLLENYLATMDPTLIENMETLLDAATAAIHKAERTVQLGMMAAVTSRSTSHKGQESYSSSPRSSQSQAGGSSKVAAFTLSDKGPKIQPTQKMEIIQRELDCLKAIYEEINEKYRKKCFTVECKKEALKLGLKDITHRHNAFDECVKKNWIDPTTHVIPGEKIIAYFETSNKNDHLQIKALITKRKNIKIQLEAVVNKINELGEELKYVDYEKLKILDRQVRENLEDTSKKVSELKKTNTINLATLDRLRKQTEKKITTARDCKQLTDGIERNIDELLKEEDKIKQEFWNHQAKLNKLIELNKRYQTPSVMDYITSKDKLATMKTGLQITERRARVVCLSNKLQQEAMI